MGLPWLLALAAAWLAVLSRPAQGSMLAIEHAQLKYTARHTEAVIMPPTVRLKGTPLSCADYMVTMDNPVDGEYPIDPDGPDGQPAITVYCEFAGGEGITIIHHDKENLEREQRKVDNCEDPGTCAIGIGYTAALPQITKLAQISSHCEQFLSYTSFASVLWWEEQGDVQYGWWMDSKGTKMTNWGGAPTGTSGCACSQTAEGCKDGRRCNANANVHSEVVDEGYLDDKDTLPVLALFFGDTGNSNDNEYGYYKVGPVRCKGGPTSVEKGIPEFYTSNGNAFRYDLPDLTDGDCRVEFRIKGTQNVYVGFATDRFQGDNMMVLGFRGATQIVFQRCKTCFPDAQVNVQDFLSPDKFKSMWVSWCDGCFRFGARGKNEMLSYCPHRPPGIIKNVPFFSMDPAHFKFMNFYSKEIITCEGKHFDIDCGDKFIDILGANYGRSSRNVCPSQYVQSTSCNNINSFSIVGNQCQGKKKCRGPVGSGLFTDPCPGTYKYLRVKYRCTKKKSSKEFLPEVCINHQCNPRGGTCLAYSSTDYVCRCRDNFGGKYCQSDLRECYGQGDPHYKGFNGARFDFQGGCKYILAQTCTSYSEKQFKVIGINYLYESVGVSVTQGLIVQIGPMEINMGRYEHVVVNGKELTAPCNLSPDISITNDGSVLMVHSPSYEVKVYWNKKNKFRVLVGYDKYKDNICGLCGDFNPTGHGYLMRDGTRTTDAVEFGNSWVSDAFNCEACQGNACVKYTGGHCALNPALDTEVKAACDPIKNPNGIFSKAHAQFDPEGMYADCIFDLCSKPVLDDNVRCNLLQEYASRILVQNRATYIQDEEAILHWRAVLNCPYTCPVKSQYSICTSPVQRTCFERMPLDLNPMACVEGCELAPGFVFENKIPIPESQCGCRYDDNYYNVDQRWMNSDCTEQCSCLAGGFANCLKVSCAANAVCKSENQVHGCHCDEDYIGDGITLCSKACPARLGNFASIRTQVDEGRHAIVDLSRPVPCEGYVRRVTVMRNPSNVETLTVVVWRRSAADDALFTVVGSAQIPIDENMRDLCACDASKLPVREGDYLGFVADTGSLLYDTTDFNAGAVMEADFLESVAPMQQVRFRTVEGRRAYSINYDMESCNGKNVEEYMYSDYLGIQSGRIADELMTASTALSGYTAAMARLDNTQVGACAWTAAVADPNQWLQVQMAHPATIVGVVTQGHCGIQDDQNSPQGCVSHFSVAHGQSVDELVYVADKEGKPEVFQTRCGCQAHSKNFFRTAIHPLYIRFIPTGWKAAISMRIELIGKLFQKAAPKVIGDQLDPDNTAVIFIGQPFDHTAYLRGLRYYASTQESFVVAVLRPNDDGGENNNFALVGQMYVTSTASSQVQLFEMRDTNHQIPVQVGDVFALIFKKAAIGFDNVAEGDGSAQVKYGPISLDHFRTMEFNHGLSVSNYQQANRNYRDVEPLWRTTMGKSTPPVMGTQPMGISDGQVRDEQLTANGFCDSNSMASRVRLGLRDQQGMTGGWCAEQLDGTGYIQVDFTTVRKIAGVSTQGLSSSFRTWYTQKYKVQCSADMNGWQFVTDRAGNPIEFPGNSDTDTEVENYFPTLWFCRGVRVLPSLWVGEFPSLRLEVLGLPDTATVKREFGFPAIERIGVNMIECFVVMPSMVFEADGFVTAVRFMAKFTGSFDLVIFRPVNMNTNDYEMVGSRKIKAMKANVEIHQNLRDSITGKDDFIAVKRGDMVGAGFVSSVLYTGQDNAESVKTLLALNIGIPNRDRLGPSSVIHHNNVMSLAYSLMAIFKPKEESEEIFALDAKDTLGLATGQFPSERITASSTFVSENPDEDFGPGSGRLKLVSGAAGCWAPAAGDGQPWIQVETKEASIFTGIVTQGRHSLNNWWVTRCKVQASVDGAAWEPVRDRDNQEAIFNANADSDTEVRILFCNAAKGRFLRVLPVEWHDHPAMRLEVLGGFDSVPNQYGATIFPRQETSPPNSIILADGMRFESDGYVVEWRIFPIATGPLRCCVCRADESDPLLFSVVGCTDVRAESPHKVATFQLYGPDQIPFRKGDAMCWSYAEPILPFDTLNEAVETLIASNTGVIDKLTVGHTQFFKRLGQQAHSIGVAVRVVSTESVPACTGYAPLGMEANLIRSASIQSTSVLSSAYGHNQARLNTQAAGSMKGCWAPATDSNMHFIMVTLDAQALITGLRLQGCNGEKRRVTAFRVDVKDRHNNFVPMLNNQGSEVFTGNMDTDNEKIVDVHFVQPLKSTVIKISPTDWFDGIGLRFEILGIKDDCTEELGVKPLVRDWKKPVNDATMTVLIDQTIPCNSIITGWKFVPANTADVTFYVLKKLTESTFTIVGKTIVQSSILRVPQETVEVAIPLGEHIHTRAGYVLAVSSVGQNPVQIQREGADMSYILQASMTKVVPVEGLWVGRTMTVNGTLSTASLSFAAVMTQEGIGETRDTVPAVSCLRSMGMKTDENSEEYVKDENLKASSSEDPLARGPVAARLSSGTSWTASKEDGTPWFQVALGHVAVLTGITTLGDVELDSWVTSFSMEYTAVHNFLSKEATNLQWVKFTSDLKDIFPGNVDAATPKTNFFRWEIEAQVMRIHVEDFHTKASMRFDFIGCPVHKPCNPNPCQNDAPCIESQASHGYTCQCLSGFGGKDCREEMKICTATGDPHYQSFDGNQFGYQGICQYYLVLTKETTQLRHFSVSADNRPVRRASATKDVFVTIGDLNFAFMQGKEVYLNGERLNPPYVRNGIAIFTRSDWVVLKSEIGLTVEWDGLTSALIYLSKSYMNEVAGLCGNFNGNMEDDWTPRGGTAPVTDVNAFGDSWTLGNECPACADCMNNEPCRQVDPNFPDVNLLELAQKACQALIDPKGAFAMCHAILDPAQIYENCMYDYCVTFPKQEALCKGIELYEMSCTEANVQVGLWRRADFCAWNCKPGMEMSQSGSACPNTCGQPMAEQECNAFPMPGCICMPGTLLEKTDQCVPKNECGCMHDGIYHMKGVYFMNEDCSEICECNSDHEPVCNSTTCHERAACSVQDGIRRCYCDDGWTGNGISHCEEILNPQDLVVCQDQRFELDCSATNERIEILAVTYGTARREECPNTAANPEPAVDHPCASTIITALCNEQDKCAGNIDTTVFGSFQDAVGKALYIRYQCRQVILVPPATAEVDLVACADQPLVLDCGFLKINMLQASFGRSQGEATCDQAGDAPLTKDCTSPNALFNLVELCHGKSTCNILPNPNIMGFDPCPETSKILRVTYQCQLNPDPRVVEEDKCHPNPCVHGTCSPYSKEPKYRCTCESHFMGVNCDVGTSTCKAEGDPHYIDFDGREFDFMGSCNYTFAKTSSGDVMQFEVVVRNMASRRSSRFSSTVAVSIEIDGQLYTIEQGGRVYNGAKTLSGLVTDNVTITLDGDAVRLWTSFGIELRFDGVFEVELVLAEFFKGKVEGLCGTYTGTPSETFLTRLGETVTDPNVFGNSWAIADETCQTCENCQIPEPCENEPERKNQVQSVCNDIISPTGPFVQCHELVPPTKYYADCVLDLCAMPDSLAYCEDYHSYADKCKEHDIIIGWRRPDFCFIDCRAKSMVYNPTGTACPATCADPDAPSRCFRPNREDCVCAANMLKENDVCVRKEDCGCVDKEGGGIYYKKDESFMTEDCSKVCKCVNQKLACEIYTCPQNEMCGSENGTTRCVCKKGYYRDEELDLCVAIPTPKIFIRPLEEVDNSLITCQDAFINVITADFGPKAADICEGEAAAGDADDAAACTQPHSLAIARNLCQGQKTCLLDDDTAHAFGLACPDVVNYLSLEFSCTHKAMEATAGEVPIHLRTCEDRQAYLACPPGQAVQLRTAFLGRKAGDTYCLQPDQDAPAEERSHPDMLAAAQTECDGKVFCTLDISKMMDPWPESEEYLELEYICIAT